MKKVVLAATTALVAAGSAAALEVTLGGEISTSVNYDGTAWSGPSIGLGDDDGVSLTISGESMGFTYGGSIDLMTGDYGSMSIGSAALGSLTLDNDGTISWSGMSVGGFSVGVTAAVADLEDASFDLAGSIGGLSVSATVENDTARTFDAEIGTAVAGASVGIEMEGSLSDTSDVDYTLSLGMAAMGFDLGIEMDDAGTLGLEASMGNLTLKTDLASGDMFGSFSATYAADLAEGLSLEAVLGNTGSATTLDITTTLSF